MELRNAKGVRDLNPKDKLTKQKIVDTLKSVFERFGFSPIETPVLELYDVLASKYSGGAEILKETFKLTDQGKRKLALRYDLTVPLCRYFGMNKNIKMPFKAYQIGRVFRDGPLKLGRYREFWQCDADCIGAKSMIADAEMIQILRAGYNELGIDAYVKFNNRKLLNEILEYCSVPKTKIESAILAIDKLDKIQMKGVKKELEDRKIDKKCIKKIQETFEALEKEKTNDKKIKKIKLILKESEGLKEVEEVLSFIENKTDIIFDPSIARGLTYYTGTVYEAFAKKSKISSAIGSGGRYDDMIGNFVGKKDIVPAIGCSFGIEPILDILSEKSEAKSTTKVYVIPIKTEKQCSKIVTDLREDGINADMDLIGRNISKNLQYADSYNIPYCLIVGEEELKKNKFQLKNMKTGQEKLIELKNIKKVIDPSL